MIKTLLNGKKVPCIPRIYVNNRHVTDLNEKCQLFNSYFSEQWTLLTNISTLPNTCFKHINSILDTIVFLREDTYKIIKSPGPNKAHGHMQTLEIVFENCLRLGKSPSEWEKITVVPTFKKGNKQSIKNYSPVSLLPVCGKVFERILYNKMFSFFFFFRKRLNIAKTV